MVIFVTSDFKKSLKILQDLHLIKILNELKSSIRKLYDKYSTIEDSMKDEYSTKTIKQDIFGIIFKTRFQNENGNKYICISLGNPFKILNTHKENGSS